MLDEMFQQNTTKFAIFLEYKNPCFLCSSIFFPNEGIHYGRNIVERNEKKKNYIGFHIPKIWKIFEVFG